PMRRPLSLLAVVLGLSAATCARPSHAPDDHDHPHPHDGEAERPGLAFTRWDADTELFVELPALVVGEESRFAAHLTRLSDYSAVSEGTMTVELGDATAVADAPSRPGIFRPAITPARAGTFPLRVRYEFKGIRG